MIDRRFLLQVASVALVVGGIGGLVLPGNGVETSMPGFVAGLLMSTLNAVAGSLCIGYAFGKPHNTFLKVVFGGMMVRMALLLAGFFVLITVFRIDTVSLTVSLFGSYLIFLVMEIFSIQRRIQAAERTSR